MAPILQLGMTSRALAATLCLQSPHDVRPFESPRPEVSPPTRSAMDAMEVDCCEPDGCWQRVRAGDGGLPAALRCAAASPTPSEYQPSTPTTGSRQLQTRSAGGGGNRVSTPSPDPHWLRAAPLTAPASPQRRGLRGSSSASGDERGGGQKGSSGGSECTAATGLSSRSSPDAFSVEQVRRANRMDRWRPAAGTPLSRI